MPTRISLRRVGSVQRGENSAAEIFPNLLVGLKPRSIGVRKPEFR